MISRRNILIDSVNWPWYLGTDYTHSTLKTSTVAWREVRRLKLVYAVGMWCKLVHVANCCSSFVLTFKNKLMFSCISNKMNEGLLHQVLIYINSICYNVKITYFNPKWYAGAFCWLLRGSWLPEPISEGRA